MPVTELEDIKMFICDDCGAHADHPSLIKHHESCNPGESAYWQEYYDQLDEPTDDDYLRAQEQYMENFDE